MSLIDISEPEVKDDNETKAPEGTEHGGDEPSWRWDSATPGSGERPEWLPEKYKSAEDTAHALKELEKRLGNAPDKYDWSKGKGWVDEEYEPLQKMAEFAKENHVPQSVFDNMLETVGTYLDEFNTDYEEERKSLGENAETRLKTVDNWAKSNFTEDTYKALIGNLRTAGDVKAIEELRGKMVENMTQISKGEESSPSTITVKDIQTELNSNLKKYKTDEGYRKEIADKMKKAVGD